MVLSVVKYSRTNMSAVEQSFNRGSLCCFDCGKVDFYYLAL